MSQPDEVLAPWPDSRRELFKVSEHANKSLNADVGYVTNNPQKGFLALVIGYKLAAEAIYQSAMSSGSSTECFMWPLVFVWRHQLEIALKELVAVCRIWSGKDWGFPTNHTLSGLWIELRGEIEKSGGMKATDLDEVGRRVAELETMDPSSMGFRYSTDKNNNEQSALTDPPQWMNLGEFHEAMEEVGSFLEIVRLELRARNDREQEQR